MENPFAVNRQTPAFNFAPQKQEGQDYVGSLTSHISGLTPIPQIYEQNRDRLGLGSLQEMANRYQEQAATLQSGLRALPQQMGERTRESLVTEGQRQRMIQSEAAPMQEQLAEMGQLAQQTGNRLAQGEALAGQLTQAELAQQERSMLPFEKEFSLLEQRQAREFAGYTFQEQQELNRLLTNAQNGLQWNNAERERANRLALQEMQYKLALDSIREQGSQARQTKKAPTDFSTFLGSVGSVM